ncbi:Uncharacterised protein [Mycobacteroides abscessus subsp. abscessus]|nr:Uncharacterised protein [Mycobacteroides abscessus subsp. abscessus]
MAHARDERPVERPCPLRQLLTVRELRGELVEAGVDGSDLGVGVGDRPAGVADDRSPALAEGLVPVAVIVGRCVESARKVADVGDPFVETLEDVLIAELGDLRGLVVVPTQHPPQRPQSGPGIRPPGLTRQVYRLPRGGEFTAHRFRLREPDPSPISVPGHGEFITHVLQHLADAPVDAVDVLRRLLVAHRWDDEEVHPHTDSDADRELDDAFEEERLLTVESAAEDEDRRRRDRDALLPDPRKTGEEDPDEEGEAERPEAHPEPVADDEGHRDPGDRGDHRLRSACDRAVDRRMDGEECGPRGEERHLRVEDGHRKPPPESGGDDRLGDLDEIRDRLGPSEAVEDRCERGCH